MTREDFQSENHCLVNTNRHLGPEKYFFDSLVFCGLTTQKWNVMETVFLVTSGVKQRQLFRKKYINMTVKHIAESVMICGYVAVSIFG